MKPSGTVSLLAGATPGVHWDHAPYYLRRVRVTADHPLVGMCREAGYGVEPAAYSDNAMVIAFPIKVDRLHRGKNDVSCREKLDLAAQVQRFWSDNQVSCTVDFDQDRTSADELVRLLSAYEDRLKAIVFLPSNRHGYEQPPYEQITEERYEELAGKLAPLRGQVPHEAQLEAQFCEGGACEWPAE